MQSSDDPSSDAHGRPGERRHVELPAAPVGLGTLLSNQLHTSSDQTSFDLARELAISQSAKVGQALRESGREEYGEKREEEEERRKDS